MYDISKILKHAFHTLCELNQDFTLFFHEFQDLMKKNYNFSFDINSLNLCKYQSYFLY